MNSVRRQPRYVDPFLLLHASDIETASAQTSRSWWFIVGLMLLVAFFGSLAITP